MRKCDHYEQRLKQNERTIQNKLKIIKKIKKGKKSITISSHSICRLKLMMG